MLKFNKLPTIISDEDSEILSVDLRTRKLTYDFPIIGIKGSDFFNDSLQINKSIPDANNSYFIGLPTSNSVMLEDENITTENVEELKIERNKGNEFLFIKLRQNNARVVYNMQNLELSDFRTFELTRNISFELKAENELKDVFLIVKNGPIELEYQLESTRNWEKKTFPLMNINPSYDFEFIIENRNAQNIKQILFIKNIALNSGFQSIFNSPKKISRAYDYLEEEVSPEALIIPFGNNTAEVDPEFERIYFEITTGFWDKNRQNSYGNNFQESGVGLTLKIREEGSLSPYHIINIDPEGIVNNLSEEYTNINGIVGKKIRFAVGKLQTSNTLFISYSIEDFYKELFIDLSPSPANSFEVVLDRSGYYEYSIGNFKDLRTYFINQDIFDLAPEAPSPDGNYLQKVIRILFKDGTIISYKPLGGLTTTVLQTNSISDVITYEDDIEEDYSWSATSINNTQVFNAFNKGIQDNVFTTIEQNNFTWLNEKKIVNYFYRGEVVCFDYTPKVSEFSILKLTSSSGEYMIVQKVADSTKVFNPFPSFDLFEILSTSRRQLQESEFQSGVSVLSSNSIFNRKVLISKSGFADEFGIFESK